MGDPSIIKPELEELLQKGTGEEIRAFLEEQHPYDIADFISGLEPNEIARVVLALGEPKGPGAFQELDTEQQIEVLAVMPRRDGAGLVEGMDADERADLFKALPEDEAEVEIPAEVRWAHKPGHVSEPSPWKFGIHFLDLTDRQQQLLEEFVGHRAGR